MPDSQIIADLKQALCRLPGVGPRTAQRMAFHLLERDRDGARLLSETLGRALQRISNCKRCNNFSEQELCPICSSSSRDPGLLCVVEAPADLEAIEKAGIYEGMYFVLMGRLSPLDKIGPEELGIDRLEALLEQEPIKEVILATNLTAEGEATAHFLTELIHRKNIQVSRIAQGVPVGGELEYTDQGTLAHAIRTRHQV
jgi:recombination protein RecR